MGLLKNYGRKDIVEIRSYLVDLVNSLCDKYEKKWTDRNESDVGMFFLELSAGISDMLNYQIDMSVRETYLPTARQRKNIKRILAITNYKMKGPVAAVSSATFSLTREVDTDIYIPKYTQIAYRSVNGNIYFATSEDCEILLGQTSVEVPIQQGIVNNINLISGDLKTAPAFEILSSNVAEDSIRLIVGDEEWTEVDDALTDEDYGTKFSVRENDEDHPYLEFGPMYRNFLPADDSTPTIIQYLDTNGDDGVVQAGTITSIEDMIVVDNVNYASVISVTNTEASSGGAARETIETAKRKAPEWIATRDNMCILDDYRIEAEHCNGIYRAAAVDWNISWNGVEGYFVSVPYEIRVFLMPADKDAYECNDTLINNVYETMSKRLWCSIKLSVEPAFVKEIDVVGTIYTRESSEIHHKLKYDAENAVKEFFAKENRKFAESYTVGNIEHLIINSNNKIDYCELSAPTSTINLSPIEFPKLGTLDLTVVRQTGIREVVTEG